MKLFFLVFITTSLVSCVNIEKNSYQHQPSIRSPIAFSSVKLESQNPTVLSSDLIKNQEVLTNFLNINVNHRNSISLVFLECEKIDRKSMSQFVDEIILPFLTLGFYPHHNEYYCPVIINIINENKSTKYIHNIEIKTEAKVQNIFFKRDSTSEQLGRELLEGTKNIIFKNQDVILK